MQTVTRGFDPKDRVQFGPKAIPALAAAARELAFLLDRGYDVKHASTFVGDHHLLSQRQRMALARAVSPAASLEERRRKRLERPPAALALDGFNTIITLEVALSGSLLLRGMDGTLRDLAGLRGSYRVVDKTHRAAELLLARLAALGVERAVFYLDQQVSNSGRLRELLLQIAAGGPVRVEVTLDPRVDGVLSRMEGVVTADAIILDRCGSWYDLNSGIVRDMIPGAWVLDLFG